MPHLSPIIWTLLYFTLWTTIGSYTINFETVNPSLINTV